MPTILYLDTETYSTVPIEAGHHRYWEGARVLCVAWATAEQKPRHLIIRPSFTEGASGSSYPSPYACPPDLAAHLQNPECIVSGWNIAFDWQALLWLHRAHGWPFVPFARTTCSMIRAAMGALPQALGQCAPVISENLNKDGMGAALMKRMCKPAPCPKEAWAGLVPRGTPKAARAKIIDKVKAEWATTHFDPVAPHNAENLARLAAYCVGDVICEAGVAASPQLPEIPPSEERLRQLDHTINARGVRVDTDLARAMDELIRPYTEAAEDELGQLTGNKIETASQTVAIRNWLEGEGLALPNLQAETVEEVLLDDGFSALPTHVQRVLQIRSDVALSSLGKVRCALEYTCADGRLRDMLRFHRASTGRWAGSGFQPQNIPRPVEMINGKWMQVSRAACDFAIQLLKSRDTEVIRMAFGELPGVISNCLRGLFIAPQGKLLVGADFAQIEARVLAWAAGETELVDLFRVGGKVYEKRAAIIYGIPESQVLKGSIEREIGKKGELGPGYQCGWKAFRKMVKKDAGITITADFAKHCIDTYRSSRPHIVQWWWDLEAAALEAVTNPGRVTEARVIRFQCEKDRWLRMRLPSGRKLYYQKPRVAYDEDFRKDCVRFHGVDRFTQKWSYDQKAYGGFWAENATQAMARDLMCDGMLAAEAAGYPIILTVHDELMSEVDEDAADVKAYEACLTQHCQAWAKDIPLKAEGWAAARYHK